MVELNPLTRGAQELRSKAQRKLRKRSKEKSPKKKKKKKEEGGLVGSAHLLALPKCKQARQAPSGRMAQASLSARGPSI